MFSVRLLAASTFAFALIVGGVQSVRTAPEWIFTKLWTHGHTTAGQVSEIPAFDPLTNTIWVAGAVGVDVLDAVDGSLEEHIDVTAHGAVNSVAIHNGIAAFAVEAPSYDDETVVTPGTCLTCDRRNPGKVLLYDTVSRELLAGTNEITVGALPDMLTFTHDGEKLLVANEATPNRAADASYALSPVFDPAGTVSIIDMATRTATTAVLTGILPSGFNVRQNTGMDFEPEYIAVDEDDTKAFVTLQEANAIAVLDLASNAFTDIIGLGVKDFNKKGNEIDPHDNHGSNAAHNDGIRFQSVAVKAFYMPDAVATYRRAYETYLVMANEGDFREDSVDRAAAGDAPISAVLPLDRLRVSKPDSSMSDLFAAGARSFSIRKTNGELVYDSGSILDKTAAALGLYDDGRSRDKGVEPEGVAILEAGDRVLAFIGLERTTQATVAVFDIKNPKNVKFVGTITTNTDLSPEGLVAYEHDGSYYLAIANEVPLPGQTPPAKSNTTLYQLTPAED